MEEMNFEGTLVLERMAEIGKLGDFYEAVDADDMEKVKNLLTEAQLERETVDQVLTQMQASQS